MMTDGQSSQPTLLATSVSAVTDEGVTDGKELPRSFDQSPKAEDNEDTEDEEVKMNCIGGLRAYEESDMSSDEESDKEDDEDEEMTEKRSESRPVVFVATHVEESGSDCKIERPRPVMVQANDDKIDRDDESSVNESETSSVGGRGMGLNLLEAAASRDTSDGESSSDEEGSSEEDDASVEVRENATEEEESDSDSEGEDSQDEVQVPTAAANDDESDAESDALSVPQDHFGDFNAPSGVSELESALDMSQATLDVSQEQPASQSEPPAENETDPAVLHPLSKRVLSSSALTGPAIASSDAVMESPKRMRYVPEDDYMKKHYLPSSLPPLSLGPSAGEFTLAMRASDAEAVLSSSDEEVDEQDRQLSEELQDSGGDDDRTNTPVPLLTPPASPVQVESEEGFTTICEWPSNLAIDNALTSVIGLRPPSPSSLQTWEQEEEERLIECRKKQTLSTSLTPLIRGISVTME